jgi:hypothetical protein
LARYRREASEGVKKQLAMFQRMTNAEQKELLLHMLIASNYFVHTLVDRLGLRAEDPNEHLLQ